MDELFQWLSDNWFSLGLLASLVTLAIKVIRKIDKYDRSLDELNEKVTTLSESVSQQGKEEEERKQDSIQLRENIGVLRKDLDQVKSDISNQVEFQNRYNTTQLELMDKLEEIAEKVSKNEETSLHQVEYNKLMVKGLKASLNGLIELGTNGPTHEALKEYEEFVDSHLFK